MSPLSLSTLQSLIDSFDGDKSLLSDGFHSFSELYESRLLLQASLFNEWSRQSLYQVHKSKFHSDGLPCFDGNWFIVMAILPTGQISNHYHLQDWSLFSIPELPLALPWDGSSPSTSLSRLRSFLSSY